MFDSLELYKNAIWSEIHSRHPDWVRAAYERWYPDETIDGWRKYPHQVAEVVGWIEDKYLSMFKLDYQWDGKKWNKCA